MRLVDLADGQVTVGPVTLAQGCILDVRAGVGPDTAVGRGSVLCALSSLPSGGRIGDGVLARSLLTIVLRLPFTVTTVALIWWTRIEYATVIDALSHPLNYLLPFAVLGVVGCVSLIVTVALEALACRALGRIQPGVISVWSLRYIRVTLKTERVAAQSVGLLLPHTRSRYSSQVPPTSAFAGCRFPAEVTFDAASTNPHSTHRSTCVSPRHSPNSFERPHHVPDPGSRRSFLRQRNGATRRPGRVSWSTTA